MAVRHWLVEKTHCKLFWLLFANMGGFKRVNTTFINDKSNQYSTSFRTKQSRKYDRQEKKMSNEVLEKDKKVEESIADRRIGIDFYKIFCCFLITTIHLFGYSDFLSIEDISLANFIVVGGISSANIVGTSGFVFITGYFLCTKGTQINLRRIITFVLQLNFVSIAIFGVVGIVNKNFSLSLMIRSFFPILTQHFWYPFNYIVLLLMSPVLNIIVQKTTKNELRRIIILLVSIICVFLKINPFYNSSIFVGHYSHSFLWWGLLYLTAAYYRQYGVKHTRLCGVGLFSFSVIMGLLLIFGEKYFPIISRFGLLEDYSIIGWLATTSSFIAFHQFKGKVGNTVMRLMKYIVPATFIAYILQEHNSVRSMLWEAVNISQYAQMPVYKVMIATVLVFVVIWAAATLLYFIYLLAKKIYLDKVAAAFELMIRKIGTFVG